MAFSDNFETIKGYAAGAAQAAAKKTKQLATIAKANLEIMSEEEKVKKAQIELGKVYYKDFILEEEPDEAEYLPWCDKITESLKLIDNLKAEIELAKAAEAREEAAEQEAAEPVDCEAEPVQEETPEEVPAAEPAQEPTEE